MTFEGFCIIQMFYSLQKNTHGSSDNGN